MDKETLSNYGWIVICVLVMVVMIALATPFGSYISEAVQSTTKGLFDVNKTALDSTGLINIDNQEFDVPDMNHGANNGGNAGETPVTPSEPETQNNLIPTGGTYTTADGTILTAGKEFPKTVVDNDVYTYGDYAYTFSSSINGWAVTLNTSVTDRNQKSYGEILATVNNKPITSMFDTFKECMDMTVAPEIPNTVVNMNGTFQSCKALISAPKLPDALVDMGWTFSVCTSLKNAPAIPENVTEMYGAFEYCQVMETAPDMSKANKVTDMSGTFYECYSMTTAPVIPSSVTTISRVTFGGCFALTDTISLPCTLESQNVTFKGCTAPVEYYHTNNCGH